MRLPPGTPWRFREGGDPKKIAALAEGLSIPRAGAEVLVRRGYGDPEDARTFLADEGLHDPFLLPELEDAAKRLLVACDAGEKIIVHGDYDADGISGAALLAGALSDRGADARPFVPDRLKDGYGVAERAIESAAEAGVKLLVTVDTGSSAHEALALAKARGVEVIVCDHHLFDRRPEGATWLLNPQREDSPYPNRDLCGCAVGWKLICGMAKLDDRIDPRPWLDLVAVAMLADQMELMGENRRLVRAGLERVRLAQRPGILALLEVSNLAGRSIESQDLAFQLAPRINAAGRIGSARDALDLLLATDMPTARRKARKLDELNRRRRTLDQQLSEDACNQAGALMEAKSPSGLVLASERWHQGVVGIGASRVAERFGVPCVLLAIDDDEAVGSARSFGGIDLKATLDGCADLLARYGGHAAAAGMRLKRSNIEAFQARFDEVAATMPRDAAGPALTVDAHIGLDELNEELIEFLERMGPFGQGNRTPIFAGIGLARVGGHRLLKDRHLKLNLGDQSGSREFMGFSAGKELLDHIGKASHVDAAFGVRYVEGSPFEPWQLILEGLRPTSADQQDA